MSSDSDSFGPPYLVKGQLWYFETVQNKLGAENMEYLRRSSLGHLFQIANITLQSPLLVVMLKNLEGTSLKRRTLSFRFNSRSIEFNREDFTLMTGLKYGMLTPLTRQQSEIHSTIFSSQRTIKFQDIHTAFLNECAKNGGSSQLALKLGLLYIVYGFFLIRDKSADDIDLKYLHLLDDVEAFIQYPWGQVAYNFLVKEMHSAAEKMAALDHHDIQFNGFTAALQLWVYEVFPNIGRILGNKLTWRVESFPRMLLWASSCCPTIDKIEANFTQIGGIEMVYIAMSPSERAAVRALYVVAEKATPHTVPVTKAKRPPCRKLDYKEAASVELVSKEMRVHEQKQGVQKVDSLGAKVSGKRTASRRRYRKIPTAPVTEAVQVQKKVQGFAKNDNENRAANRKRVRLIPTAPVITITSTSASNTKMEKPKDDESVGDNTLDLKLNDILSTLREVRDCCQLNFEMMKEIKNHSDKQGLPAPRVTADDPLEKTMPKETSFYPMHWKAPTVPEFVLGCDSRAASGSMFSVLKEQNAVPKPYMYDPTESAVNDEDINGFTVWRETAASTDEIELPSTIIRNVTNEWFDDIWDRSMQLYNDHIDALTSLLLLKKSENPDAFMDCWTLMEQTSWPVLTSPNLNRDIQNLWPYVRGSYPRVGGVAWEDVDFVYGIGHVLGNHWVAYECNFVEQSIVIYDPLSETGWKNAVVDEFRSVARALPAMIKMGDVWTKKGWKEASLKTEWNIIYNKRNPQQSNSTDCGIMAMKFIECLVSANSLYVINPERCGFFRKVYCSQLYNARLIE